MIREVRRWLRNQKNTMQKTSGLAEKQASIKQKLDVAMSILQDERKEDLPVSVERRKFA